MLVNKRTSPRSSLNLAFWPKTMIKIHLNLKSDLFRVCFIRWSTFTFLLIHVQLFVGLSGLRKHKEVKIESSTILKNMSWTNVMTLRWDQRKLSEMSLCSIMSYPTATGLLNYYLNVYFPLTERFSGWCLCCCPPWSGSSRFRSVTRKVRRSRKVSSSSAWCCPSCCRKPSASVTTSCWSESQLSHSWVMLFKHKQKQKSIRICLLSPSWMFHFHSLLHFIFRCKMWQLISHIWPLMRLSSGGGLCLCQSSEIWTVRHNEGWHVLKNKEVKLSNR